MSTPAITAIDRILRNQVNEQIDSAMCVAYDAWRMALAKFNISDHEIPQDWRPAPTWQARSTPEQAASYDAMIARLMERQADILAHAAAKESK